MLPGAACRTQVSDMPSQSPFQATRRAVTNIRLLMSVAPWSRMKRQPDFILFLRSSFALRCCMVHKGLGHALSQRVKQSEEQSLILDWQCLRLPGCSETPAGPCHCSQGQCLLSAAAWCTQVSDMPSQSCSSNPKSSRFPFTCVICLVPDSHHTKSYKAGSSVVMKWRYQHKSYR